MQSHIPMSKPHFGDRLGDREDRDCVGFCLGDCEDQDGCTPNGYEMGTCYSYFRKSVILEIN